MSTGPCVTPCATSTSEAALFSNLLCRARSSPQTQQTFSTPARHGRSRSIVRPIKISLALPSRQCCPLTIPAKGCGMSAQRYLKFCADISASLSKWPRAGAEKTQLQSRHEQAGALVAPCEIIYSADFYQHC